MCKSSQDTISFSTFGRRFAGTEGGAGIVCSYTCVCVCKTSEQLYACNYVLWRIMSLHWSGQNEAIICKSELISPTNRIPCVRKLFPLLSASLSTLPVTAVSSHKYSPHLLVPLVSPLHLLISPCSSVSNILSGHMQFFGGCEE